MSLDRSFILKVKDAGQIYPDKVFGRREKERNYIIMKRLLWIGVLMLFIPVTGCSADAGVQEETAVPLPVLNFENPDMTVNVGDVVTLALTRDGTGRELAFSSSDETVATVTADGVVTAVAGGSAVITSVMDGVTATLNLTVLVPRYINIELDRNIYSIGDTVSFGVSMNPDDGIPYTVTFAYADIEDDEPKAVFGNSLTVTEAGLHTIMVETEDAAARIQFIVFDLEKFARDTFELTNAEREKAGLPLFGSDIELDFAAQIRAEEQAELFSHTRPDGGLFATAFLEAGVTAGKWGENLAGGQRSAAEALEHWMDSEGHREAILDENYTHLGTAVFMDGNGKVFWVQTFRG